jgi:nitric oxide reductase NorD protein
VVVAFAQVQRPLAIFARGLLGRGMPIHRAPAGTTRAFANEHGWFFPEHYTMYSGQLSRDAFFAAAAHLAAHTLFGAPRMVRGALRPIQVVLVSTFEDARVEQLMMRELPGLRALFARFHAARANEVVTFPALCARIARALFDPSYQDAHPLVEKARAGALGQPREWGSRLGNDVGQTRLSFNAKDFVVDPPYRDDHRLLWEEPAEDAQAQLLDSDQGPAEVGKADRPEERAREVAQPASSAEQRSYRYHEYDHRIRASRPGWTTVLDQTVVGAAVAPRVDVSMLANRLRLSSLARRRREHEGDALDLPAALDATIALRAGSEPDARVFVRMSRQRQTLALTVLLDLSASTGDIVRGQGVRVLDLARDATLLLCEVLAHAGDRFAVHGFSSNGRHRVEYLRYKELDQPWTDHARGAVHALAPLRSTRMGAAIRHAARSLRGAREQRRVVLLLTDGAPSDIDVHDPRYLVHDAQRAVAEARREGLSVFAVTLDRAADRYVGTIFGPARYLVLDHPEKLPQVLTRLYARLAG